MNKFASLVALSLMVGSMAPTALAASYPVGGAIPVAPQAAVTSAAPVVIQQAASPVVNSPVFAPIPVQTVINNPVFPKDTTDILLPKVITSNKTFNSKGIKEVDNLSSIDTSGKGILFHAEEGSTFEQTTANSLNLKEGSILLSLHGPAAQIETANGTVQVIGEGDILTTMVAGVFRVANISARGTACKVKMEGKATEADTRVVALAPGYELVVGDRHLLSGEIRPADGIARRNQFIFDGKHIAVNEFSVASMLTTHPIVASMLENTTREDRRVINDMCKMAAVMNYVHGSNGYKQAEGSGIATRPGRNTQ